MGLDFIVGLVCLVLHMRLVVFYICPEYILHLTYILPDDIFWIILSFKYFTTARAQWAADSEECRQISYDMAKCLFIPSIMM